jgi:hypothetical protein
MTTPERLSLVVPESVGAFYAVPTTNGSVDTSSLVAAALGQVEESLPRPLPQPLVQVHPVGDLPPLPIESLAATGATGEQVARLRSATHLVLVSVGGRPGWPPAHEWISRTLAAGAAARLGSDVVDLITHEVLELTSCQASLPDRDGLVCLTNWVGVEWWPDGDGYSCATTGLRRFGLPELQTLGMPPSTVDSWGSAMVGLAGQLIAGWRDALTADLLPASVTLPATLSLTATDVIETHARITEKAGPQASAGGPDAATVRLVHQAGADGSWTSARLTVRPPASWPGTPDEHLADACKILFGQSTGDLRVS